MHSNDNNVVSFEASMAQWYDRMNKDNAQLLKITILIEKKNNEMFSTHFSSTQ